MKAKTGIKFAIGLAVIFGLFYGYNKLYVQFFVLPREFPVLKPGKANLIGIKLDGERIVISNGTARLLQGGGSEFGSDGGTGDPSGDTPDSASEGGGMPIPLGAVVGALQQNSEAAGELVSAFSQLDTATIPPAELVWDANDVRRALDGDEALTKRLEADICQRLDGALLVEFRKSRVRSGIYIRLHAPVRIPNASGRTVLHVPVVVGFKTVLVERVSNNAQIKGEFDPTDAAWRGVYVEEADNIKQLPKSTPRESLEAAISVSRTNQLAEAPSLLLARVTVLATETEMIEAELETKPKTGGKGEIATVRLEVNDDSRMRLWQYTIRHPRCQLLFIYDGIGVAAPFVKSEMKYSTVTITNVTDTTTAHDAVEVINQKHKQ